MPRADALIDARLTVQVWRRLPPYIRVHVRGHVARALGVPPFLAGNRSGNCGAADLRGGRGQRKLSANVNNPRYGGRGLHTGNKAGKLRSCILRIPNIAGFCKPEFRVALDVRPNVAIRAPE